MLIECLTEDDAWLALPERETLARRAAGTVFEVLGRIEPDSEVSVAFTSDAVVAELNRRWRGKPEPTNVLSFPAAAGVKPGPPAALGDIVLAAGVVGAEARAQCKTLENHTTHLIIHGMLHILGYDHADDATAETMEGLEVRVMARLGLPDPYEDGAGRSPALLDER